MRNYRKKYHLQNKDVSLHCNNNNNKNNNVVDKYTTQVLDFLRNTSKEIKDAEWDRISNLGLPNILVLLRL